MKNLPEVVKQSINAPMPFPDRCESQWAGRHKMIFWLSCSSGGTAHLTVWCAS